MKLFYTLEPYSTYNEEGSRVTVPELAGKPVVQTPDEIYVDDEYLDIMHFRYSAYFLPYDSPVFTDLLIRKDGGDDECARATSYAESLTREEADAILREFIARSLGLEDPEDIELETDSTAFIEENPDFDDEDEDEEEFDEFEDEEGEE